jgi:hypothetical protein
VAGRRRRPARPKVQRKIYFYRVDAGSDEAGHPIPYDPTPALNRIRALPFRLGLEGNYWDGPDDSVTCCWVDEPTAPQRLRLGDVRRRYLPRVEAQGVLSDLTIPPGSGIAEEIHVVFFPDNIVGSEFNFYGPRISRLRRYLAVKTSDVARVPYFEPLLRRDVTEKIDALEDVRLFQLKIRRSWVDAVRAADQDLGAAFDAAARAGEAEEVEIVLKSRAYSREPIAERLLQTARRLVGVEEVRSEAARFQLRGENAHTGRVETIDLLTDKLISSQQIVLASEQTRSLDSRSAYAAINRAYRELHDDLLIAAGVEAEAVAAE